MVHRAVHEFALFAPCLSVLSKPFLVTSNFIFSSRFSYSHRLGSFPLDYSFTLCTVVAGTVIMHENWQLMRTSIFADFDSNVSQILAPPLMKASLLQGNAELATKCIAMGSPPTLHDLEKILQLGGDLHAKVQTSRFGRATIALTQAHFGRPHTVAARISQP